MNGITNKPDAKAVDELWAYVRKIIAREGKSRQARAQQRQIRQACIETLENPWLPDYEALRRVRELID